MTTNTFGTQLNSAKAKATWFINPNHDRTSLMFLGMGKSRMFCKYFFVGWILSFPTENPAYSTSSAPNTNFLAENTMPDFAQYDNIVQTQKNAVSRSPDQVIISSTILS